MKKSIRILAVVLVVLVMSTNVFADNFTPSVEQKGSPEIVTTTDNDGKEIAAVISDAKDDLVTNVPTGDVVLTSVANAAAATTPDAVKAALQAAQTQIKNAADVSALLSAADAEALKKANNPVVRDLIDITLTGDYADKLAVEGNTITITFKLGLASDAFLAVLHNYEADKWEKIADENVKVLANGAVEVTFDSLSPVAFVVENPQGGNNNAPSATSNNYVLYALIAAAVVVVIVIIVLVASRKKSKPEEAAKTE